MQFCPRISFYIILTSQIYKFCLFLFQNMVFFNKEYNYFLKIKIMKNYFFNFLLTAIVAYLLAALSFLIGNEAGTPSVATATASGVFVGIATALSYCFGKLRAGAAFDWKELVVALVGGVGAGLLGGLQMGL